MIGAPLHVHVLGATRDRRAQQAEALLLAPAKQPAFPSGTAGHDHRAPAALERTGDVYVRHTIQAELDDVGGVGGITGTPELGHRCRRHGFADQCHPNPKRKKPLQLC